MVMKVMIRRTHQYLDYQLVHERNDTHTPIQDLLLEKRLFFGLLWVLTIGPNNHWPVQVRLCPGLVRDEINSRAS